MSNEKQRVMNTNDKSDWAIKKAAKDYDMNYSKAKEIYEEALNIVHFYELLEEFIEKRRES